MNCSTNVPYWVIALKVGCALSQVIAASGGLSYWSIELYTLASIPCETNGYQNENRTVYWHLNYCTLQTLKPSFSLGTFSITSQTFTKCKRQDKYVYPKLWLAQFYWLFRKFEMKTALFW